MKAQPVRWMLVWRVISVFALVGSWFFVPACGSGSTGSPGAPGLPGTPAPSTTVDPLSAVVAAVFDPTTTIAAGTDIPSYVKAAALAFPTGNGSTFPVPQAATDSVRTIPGIKHNVVVSWLDTLTFVVPGRVNL